MISLAKNVFILFLVAIMHLTSLAKKHTGKDVRLKADSILIKIVGKRIFDQNIKAGDGHYSYTDWTGDKVNYERLYSNRRIYGTPQSLSIKYTFCLKDYPSFKETIEVELDHSLVLKSISSLDFIPKYVINNSTPVFIAAEQAKMIADTAFIKKGIDPVVEPRLIYDSEAKIYVWEVIRLTYVDEKNREAEYQRLKINAETSELLQKGEYYSSIEY